MGSALLVRLQAGEPFPLLEQVVAQEPTMGGGHSVIQRVGIAVQDDVVVTLPQQFRRF